MCTPGMNAHACRQAQLEVHVQYSAGTAVARLFVEGSASGWQGSPSVCRTPVAPPRYRVPGRPAKQFIFQNDIEFRKCTT